LRKAPRISGVGVRRRSQGCSRRGSFFFKSLARDTPILKAMSASRVIFSPVKQGNHGEEHSSPDGGDGAR